MGLDLEEVEDDYVRVEYNPNRPDFSTDYGIARALKGLLGTEVRTPRYTISKGSVRVIVDGSVRTVRPYIVGAVVKKVRFDNETIRQIISMQEDLHNGIGRRRRKVAIGIHNFAVLTPPIRYTTAGPDFTFVPLGYASPLAMREILAKTEPGQRYGDVVRNFPRYPILLDSKGNVLSFPPIINGELTRVTSDTTSLFIDVTGTGLQAVENALSVISATFGDMGCKLESVTIQRADRRIVTPNLKPGIQKLNIDYARRLLGLNLSTAEMVECLARSRITALARGKTLEAFVPAYRIDMLHPVDLVEEVAIGYGVDKISPKMPETQSLGAFEKSQESLGVAREALISLGLTEVMNFSLVSRAQLHHSSIQVPELYVDNPKTSEHEVLRPSLLPSILHVLSQNTHEEYPQRIFEVSEVFSKDGGETAVEERYHAAAAIAHSQANFSEIKSYLASFMSSVFGEQGQTFPKDHSTFADGRAAGINFKRWDVGVIGEVLPAVLENYGLRVPVAAFELDLTIPLGLVERI